MAHPDKLMKDCVKLLKQDYYSKEYSYILDGPLVGNNESNIRPDIQILEKGKLICVCEIGYTRPEKIKKYREMGIRDIRWYSKDLELIHQESDETKPLEQVKTETQNMLEQIERDALKRIENLEKKVIEDSVSKLQRDHENRVREILQDRPYHLSYSYECPLCLEEDKIDPKEMDAGEYIYFNERGYNYIVECDTNTDHDSNEYFSWDDEDGPYEGQFKELLKEYIEFMLDLKKRIKEHKES